MKRSKLIYSILYGVLIAILALSTLSPHTNYGAWWFVALWALAAIGLVVFMARMRMWRKPTLFVLHGSMLVILAGGAVTWLTARQSTLILQPGKPQTQFGLTIELEEFTTQYYPGGQIPQNYTSRLKVNGKPMLLEVNKPLSVHGCRIYQQSFGEGGISVISLRKDLVGTMLTFIGYGLFVLGGLLCLLPKRFKALAVIGLCAVAAQARTPVVPRTYAHEQARKQVVYQGRVCTFSTVAHDVMLKVYGKTSYEGLSAEQTVLSLMEFPLEWLKEPVIKHGTDHISLNDCFDAQGRYLMTNQAETDERVGIIMMLCSDKLFSEPGPDDERLSDARVTAEIIFNNLNLTLCVFFVLIISAALAFWRAKWGRIFACVALALQLVVLAWEYWLTDHGPFTSTFETLQLLVAVVTLFSLLIRSALPIGLVAASCMAFVAYLQAINPVVTPLMPVLHSPWLSLHVSLVMFSYALFLIVACMAVRALFTRTYAVDEARCRRLLRPAVFLLGAGIFSGAVWANEAWGRYWGWDPKETWALITFMLYAIPLHMRRPSLWWYIVPLLSVGMTYFGVNYLTSLHAYS